MYQSVDVAAISFRPKKFDLADNADRLEAMFRAAAEGGAQLALAPEGVLEGYVVMELITGEEPKNGCGTWPSPRAARSWVASASWPANWEYASPLG